MTLAGKKIIYVGQKRNLTMYLTVSLFLILLTFFVVLTSLSVQDLKRQRFAIGSVMGSFGILPGGRSPISNLGSKNLLPPGAPLEQGEMDIRKINTALAEAGTLGSVSVSEGKLGTTITIKAGILFDGQTDGFSRKSARTLDAVAAILTRIDNPIIITGHTDSIPVETPPFNSNWGLSAARALAVLSYLESRGIVSGRLAAYGMGANHPLTTNNTEAGRRLNRRVEITIVGDLPGNVDLKSLEQSARTQGRSIFYKGYNFDLEEQ